MKRKPSSPSRHPHVGAPHPVASLIESRAMIEMALLPSAWPILFQAPAGDGHPVLLLPGFLADERSLIALKTLLKNKGYAVESWGLGRNVGFHSKYVKALEQKIRYMHYKSGQKVSLVGWSLGGVFSLVGALQAPECIRSVITLGSPVSSGVSGASHASPMVKALYRMVAHPMGSAAHAMQPRAAALRKGKLPPVPISCLFSLGDGVVPPQEATIDGDPAMHENIQVVGSHVGLGFNSIVLAIVADRLAQPEDNWRPFEPTGLLKSAYEMSQWIKEPA